MASNAFELCIRAVTSMATDKRDLRERLADAFTDSVCFLLTDPDVSDEIKGRVRALDLRMSAIGEADRVATTLRLLSTEEVDRLAKALVDDVISPILYDEARRATRA